MYNCSQCKKEESMEVDGLAIPDNALDKIEMEPASGTSELGPRCDLSIECGKVGTQEIHTGVYLCQAHYNEFKSWQLSNKITRP